MINYYLLTKPGIILGNLFTVAAGFLLASRGQIVFWLFLATVIGLGLIIASACVFNNYIDRDVDRKMERTKNRVLVKGLISGRKAIAFGVALGVVGVLILLAYTNVLTVLVAGVGFFVYVFLYSLWKRHTIYGTAIGSIAGAVPPVVGYCAVSNQFDLAAFILFMIMVMWQMPHFFAIAIYHLDDYARAGIPVLPVKRGLLRAKVHMIVYIVGFILTSILLTVFGYTGYLYLFVITGVGWAWLALCVVGFQSRNDQLWGRDMFRVSLVMIAAFCVMIPLDIV